MDEALRNIYRRIHAGDLTAISNFIGYSYRLGWYPQDVFERLRELLGLEQAEKAVIAFHEVLEEGEFNKLQRENEGIITELDHLFAQRGWGPSGDDEVETHTAFPKSTAQIRVLDVCPRCQGTGNPLSCKICESDYPCIHYTFLDMNDSNYPSPECDCNGTGSITTRSIFVFRDAFYRYVWENLVPPNIKINKMLCQGRNYCNLLLEQNIGQESATIHAYVSPARSPANRHLTPRLQTTSYSPLRLVRALEQEIREAYLRG